LCHLWDNVAKLLYSQTGHGWHYNMVLHCACWITEATNTYPDYVILTAFPWQPRLHKHLSVTSYYIACLVRFQLGFAPATRILVPGSYMGGADRSLAWPASRCCRTESIVSLEKGSVHVWNCKSFLVTEAERKHVRRRARFQQHRDASCHHVFFSCKARHRRKFTPFWQKHWGNMHHRVPPSKTGWPRLSVVIFPPVMRLVLILVLHTDWLSLLVCRRSFIVLADRFRYMCTQTSVYPWDIADVQRRPEL